MTDINPAITVIICMYKGEATVCRMIDCVLNQTFKDFELILVDDGSPDRCGEIADEYSKKDNRVRVLHKPNGGLADARNHALDIARGEYTIQFDQDDWVELNCLEEMYAEAKRQNADMLICDYYYNDEFKQEYVKQTPTSFEHWIVFYDVLIGNIYGYCWNKLIRLDVYKKFDINFPLDFYGCEDQYGICQLLKNNIIIAYLPQAFCHYLNNWGSLSRFYNENTYNNDLYVRDQFVSLLSNTPYENLKDTIKVNYIVGRAFTYGENYFSSQSFKDCFAKYKNIVLLSNVSKGFKLLYFLSFIGQYKFARKCYGTYNKVKYLIRKSLNGYT